jgi:hypothetical protein
MTRNLCPLTRPPPAHTPAPPSPGTEGPVSTARFFIRRGPLRPAEMCIAKNYLSEKHGSIDGANMHESTVLLHRNTTALVSCCVATANFGSMFVLHRLQAAGMEEEEKRRGGEEEEERRRGGGGGREEEEEEEEEKEEEEEEEEERHRRDLFQR